MKYIIYQHLGIGDQLICNGLVREIVKGNPNDKFYIVTKPTSADTIKFMYRDLKELEVLVLSNGDFTFPENPQEVQQLAYALEAKILYVGHGNEPHNYNFDKAFYAQFNIDFSKRWSSFKVERDLKREQALFDKLEITGKYIFVHEDNARGMGINRGIRNGIRVIKASTDLTTNLFDYLSLIELATEVHCIESSFLFLIDSFNIDVPLFAHRYARNYPARNTPTLKLPWEILI